MGKNTQRKKDINIILEIQRMKLFLTKNIYAFTVGRGVGGGKWKVNIYGQKNIYIFVFCFFFFFFFFVFVFVVVGFNLVFTVFYLFCLKFTSALNTG